MTYPIIAATDVSTATCAQVRIDAVETMRRATVAFAGKSPERVVAALTNELRALRTKYPHKPLCTTVDCRNYPEQKLLATAFIALDAYNAPSIEGGGKWVYVVLSA